MPLEGRVRLARRRWHSAALVIAVALPALAIVLACQVRWGADLLLARAEAADDPVGLAGLRRVAVSLDLEAPLDDFPIEDVLVRLEELLRGAEPALAVQDSAPDRVRLAVLVRPVNATTLRGFWLPFSGTYGVGALRLSVERTVTLSGVPRPFPATVWHTERVVAGPWRSTGPEVMRLLEDMAALLLEARRQVR
jgi:hypothetical protein